MLNKIYKSLVLAIFIIMLPSQCFADSDSGLRSIKYYKIDENALIVYTKWVTKFVDSADCKNNNEFSAQAIAIPTARENFPELYTEIILAHGKNEPISFLLDGLCTSNSAGGPFPTAKEVYINQQPD